jgi:hypothetical protein
MAKFQKGEINNPRGRPAGQLPARTVLFDLKQAARSHCERAIQVIAEAMESADEKVAVTAAAIMLDRGYGKPEQKADVAVVHKFAVVPQVMEKAEWLANKGQPKALPPPDPDRKLN